MKKHRLQGKPHWKGWVLHGRIARIMAARHQTFLVTLCCFLFTCVGVDVGGTSILREMMESNTQRVCETPKMERRGFSLLV